MLGDHSSIALSGWGISPAILKSGDVIPAMSSIEPFGLSIAYLYNIQLVSSNCLIVFSSAK